MTPEIIIALLQNGGVWVFYAYIFFIHVLPKISPSISKIMGHRENQLISIIKDSNKTNEKIAVALSELSIAINQLNHRVEKVEDVLKNNKCPSSNNKD